MRSEPRTQPGHAVLTLLAAASFLVSCVSESPTGTTRLPDRAAAFDAPPSGPPSGALTLRSDLVEMDALEDVVCESVESIVIVRARFGKPGWVRANRVGLYVFLRDIPTDAEARVRVWWDYSNEWGLYEDLRLPIGTDAFEEVLEHEYPDIVEPTEKLVRVALIVEGAMGDCARNRWVTVYPTAGGGGGGGPPAPTLQTANVGPLGSSDGTPFLPFFASEGVRFTVATPLTIDSVAVEPSAAGTVVVNLVDVPTGTTLASTSAVVAGPGSQRIPLGFSVTPPGPYALCMQGSTPGPPFFALMAHSGATYPYTIPGVISLTDTALGLGGFPPFNYFFFYDWQVTW